MSQALRLSAGHFELVHSRGNANDYETRAPINVLERDMENLVWRFPREESVRMTNSGHTAFPD
jgi:hypothetical protein